MLCHLLLTVTGNKLVGTAEKQWSSASEHSCPPWYPGPSQRWSWLQNWEQGEQIKLCNQPTRLSSYTKLDCGQLPRFDQYTNPTKLARVLMAVLFLFELCISFCVSVTKQSSLFHVSYFKKNEKCCFTGNL